MNRAAERTSTKMGFLRRVGAGTGGPPLVSEHSILAYLAGIKQFRSVVEFRCGHAKWLHAARQLGASDIRGYDSSAMPAAPRGLSDDEFLPADFRTFIELDRKFDLALCREGPHISDGDSATVLVRTLCEASNCVLFAAPLPCSSGSRQPNERWIESWAKLFRGNGFVCYDILRRHFWHDSSIAVHYRQNACLYVRLGAHYPYEARGLKHSPCPPTLVHPETFIGLTNQIPGQKRITMATQAYYQLVEKVGGSHTVTGAEDFTGPSGK